jgi:hypothetical protein
MPWVTANLCDDSPGHPCPPGELDLSKDKQCSTIQRSVHKWAGGIKETRWVCPLLTDKPGARYSSSVTLFQVGKKKVFMTYVATEHDTPPTEFLDEVGKGMRPE